MIHRATRLGRGQLRHKAHKPLHREGYGMTDTDKRSLELQVFNKTDENFVITRVLIADNSSHWIADEKPKIGATVAIGSSATWGVEADEAGKSAAGEVFLKGSKGSNIYFIFQNLYNGICTVEMQLSPNVLYTAQPIAAVDQIQSTAQVVMTSA
jgi:hypothetical protein